MCAINQVFIVALDTEGARVFVELLIAQHLMCIFELQAECRTACRSSGSDITVISINDDHYYWMTVSRHKLNQ